MNDEAKITKITDSINREVLGGLPVDLAAGGAQPFRYDQMLDLAKTMATAKHSIREHLRGNPGDCLAIWDMAMNSGLAPYALARHCYVVNNILCFEAQVISALIAKHAPLKQRLRYRFEGEGEERKVIVTGHFKGEVDPVEYTSPPIGLITPKNSPLWKSDPDQQLCYFGVRRWGRRYCPDVLLGVYAKDEIEDGFIGPDNAKDVSPNLLERLPGRIEGDGFTVDAGEAERQEQEAIHKAEALKEVRKASLAKARAAKKAKESGLYGGGSAGQKAPQSPTEAQGEAQTEGAVSTPTEEATP